MGFLIGLYIVKVKIKKYEDTNKNTKNCWECCERELILTFSSGLILRIALPLSFGGS